jgi:hypothetical protein
VLAGQAIAIFPDAVKRFCVRAAGS